MLSDAFEDFTPRSRPWQFYTRFDVPDSEYEERALNPERYRDWRSGYAWTTQ